MHAQKLLFSVELPIKILTPSLDLATLSSYVRIFWWSVDICNVPLTFDPLNLNTCHIFTALHVMQTRYSEENSVRLSVCRSVCLSVCQTRDLWQNGRKIGPDFYTIRKNIQSSFLRRRMVGGGRPLLHEILGQPTPIGAKSPIFNQ